MLGAAVVLAGCAETRIAADPAAVRAAQEQACAAVVAPHEGVPVSAVTATWDGATPEGLSVVSVRSPESVHSCEVDDALRVRRVLHPGH
jgi:alkylhydroperoxidase family enzyme